MKQSQALKILKNGQNVFITGSAGTGKTHLLHSFVEYLSQRRISPAIVAPTGIAASHLGGQTIHSYFSLGIREYIDEYALERMLEKKYLISRFSKLRVLIVDEVSMISPEIFDSIDMILRAFKNADEPFGGVQVVLSGDFFQLPPVSREFKEKRFAWQSNAWRELDLRTCYLMEKFRQDDDKLIQVLDDIREGNINDNTHATLQTRYRQNLNISFEPTRLYTHNIDVDHINLQELNKLPSKEKVFLAEIKGAKSNIEKIFKSSLVLEKLTLKKDAVVIFIKNNHESGYVNGTTGVVIGFDKIDGLPIVRLASGKDIYTDREDWSVENDSSKVIAKVSQIPLRLAWAITIHKSQGMTLDAAEIDLSKTFEAGQGYVALSRIRNIEGLKLMGINDMALRVDPLILKIDNRIKIASQKSEDELSAISKEQLEKIQNKHIELSGGTTNIVHIREETKRLKTKKEFVPKSSNPTHIETKNLIPECDTIDELAIKRAMTTGSIIKHLIKLQSNGEDIDKYKPDDKYIKMVTGAYRIIKDRNSSNDKTENGEMKLKPIFEMLDEELSYDDIRFALTFVDKVEK